jgi:hypothetical protein
MDHAMKDAIVVGTLVLAFALFLTAHVAITYGLVFRPPRWRAIAALVVAPLAPYWAWREHMRIRAGVWTGALLLYAAATIAAQF